VSSGHPRAPRAASDLAVGRLTRCVKRPSKQRVAGDVLCRLCGPDGEGQAKARSDRRAARTFAQWWLCSRHKINVVTTGGATQINLTGQFLNKEVSYLKTIWWPIVTSDLY
jgi:hypothetical protein